MKCPICGTLLPPNTERCPDCGYRCTGARPQPAAAAPTTDRGYYTPPNQSGCKKGCCCAIALILPVILLLTIAVFGIVGYVQEELLSEEFEYGFFEEDPFGDYIYESLPYEADEGCFSIRGGVLTFLPGLWDESPVLRVPETVDGETVTTIGPGCFRDCDFLTTIVLPGTVTEIGREAFAGCSELRGLFLPEGTESIGLNAFAGCVNLEAISIPATVTEIAPGCFDDCAALLFLFYGGEFEAWEELYSDYITPYTTAICIDGGYYHGAGR